MMTTRLLRPTNYALANALRKVNELGNANSQAIRKCLSNCEKIAHMMFEM